MLDASGNGIGADGVEAVLDLYRLETLILADNDIQEMAQVRSQRTTMEALRCHFSKLSHFDNL